MTQLFKRPTIQAPAPAAAPTPAPVVEAPVVPTVDDAVRNQDMTDRIRRRKGARSTQLVPNNFAAPLVPVGQKTALGQ